MFILIEVGMLNATNLRTICLIYNTFHNKIKAMTRAGYDWLTIPPNKLK